MSESSASPVLDAASLRAFIDVLPAPAAVLMGDDLHVNLPFALLTGYPREVLTTVDACFSRLFGAVAPETRRAYESDRQAGFGPMRLWHGHAADGAPLILEFRGRRLDGADLWLVSDATEGRRELLRDQQMIEAQLRHAQKLESLSVLAGGIAHDFNNLLTSILGYASLARMELPAECPQREYLEEVEKAARRAAELTRQMLAYSGRGKFVLGPVQLKRLVLEMVPFIEATLARRAGLELDLHDGLPFIDGDEQQLRQVLLSLVANAAEAIDKPRGAVRIALSQRRLEQPLHSAFSAGLAPGLFAVLEIRDNGCGMDRDTLQRIFDPFFSTKFIGRGLGLAAALGIIRAHRGLIRVESEPGQGASIEILLPARSTAAEAVAAPARPRGTVLVVDDEDDLRAMVQHMLEGDGYRVLCAADGFEAERLVRQSSREISAILLDLTMPGRSGEETLKALRRFDGRLPIFLMSGRLPDKAAAVVEGVEYNGFIQKPFGREDLLAFLRLRLAEETGGAGAAKG
ncbi:MAG: response regulator [Gemmataceae bacterium]